jgi:hypothetical protein
VPTLAELHEERNQHIGTIAALQEKVEGIDQQILAATQDKVRQMFSLSGKQSGTVSVYADGMTVKGEVSKKVTYDSKALMRVAAEMPWATVQKVFDIAFKVPEKTYKTLATLVSPEERAAIEGARTTVYGELKVTLEVKA